jgi:PIN domain nuclease of toxin-antitoxin system
MALRRWRQPVPSRTGRFGVLGELALGLSRHRAGDRLEARQGKLILPAPAAVWFPAMIAHHGCELLAIDAPAAIASTQLARIHADPFDRLLVATALARGLVLITSDLKIQQYPDLQTLW